MSLFCLLFLMNKRFFIFFFLFTLIIGSFFYPLKRSSEKNYDVLVTVAPYKYFTDYLTDHSLRVKSLVPEEGSPHGFDPSARQLLELSHASVWLTIGEPFESKLKTALGKNPPQIIDLGAGIDSPGGGCKHSRDLHFWLSPRTVQKQIPIIAEALIRRFPDKKELIEQRKKELTEKLEILDRKASSRLRTKRNTDFLVSHPAFAYFCRDYGLHQFSLENEGLDPSPKELANILEKVKNKNFTKMYVQKQYNFKAAQLVSRSHGLEMIEVNPYAENYFENLEYLITRLGEE